ncbi:MAG: TonB family protein [Bacteroidia bacterium]
MKLFRKVNTPSFNEIVFESRNKTYGAFALRNSYERHLFYAFLLTSGLLIATVLWVFLNYRSPILDFDESLIPDLPYEIEILDIKPPQEKNVAPPSTPEKKETRNNLNKDDLTPTPVEKKIEKVAAVDSLPYSSGNGDADPGDVNSTNNKGETGTGTPGTVGGSDGTDVNKVVEFAEVEPSFPGGIEKMYAFLGKNIRYPQFMKVNRMEGTVFVSFVVNRDGDINQVEILSAPHDDFAREVKRVIAKMPKWQPGKQAGQPVNVRYRMPVKFTLR